jgi:steroid delta-isomerase-like uncharacterized protein
MSVETTERVMRSYLGMSDARVHEVNVVAEDATFVNVAAGDEVTGREAIAEMLEYFYRIAFDARAEITNLICGDGKAAAEASVTGKHVGEFAGVPATGRDVHYMLCVVYDVDTEKAQITHARIYVPMNVIMQQIGAV